MVFLSDNKQAAIIDALNTTSRYLDDIKNIYNVYFDKMVSQIYPSDLQLNKANTSGTEAVYLDLYSIDYSSLPSFLLCICPFLMILFLPKFMINVTMLNLKLSISHF